MSIEEQVHAVEFLYQNLEIEITAFQKETKLSCLAGCGRCCTHPELDASPLEFLPWAFDLFLNGKAEETLEKLNQNTAVTCFLYQPKSLAELTSGSCGNYQYRALICRLFGFGASTDKYGKLRIATCTIIKESQADNFNKANVLINNGIPVPIFTDYYMKLSQINFQLGNVIVPINKALKLAIEEVLHYYAYRDFPENYMKTI